MIEFVITFALLLGVFLPILIRELKDPHTVRAKLTVVYDGSECFEPAFLRALKGCSGMLLTVTVVDAVKTEESRRWLAHLSEKTDIRFDIM